MNDNGIEEEIREAREEDTSGLKRRMRRERMLCPGAPGFMPWTPLPE
jgi:hypothetical protein